MAGIHQCMWCQGLGHQAKVTGRMKRMRSSVPGAALLSLKVVVFVRDSREVGDV